MPDTVLLVTHHDPSDPGNAIRGGRESLSALNHDALLQIYGERLKVLTLRRVPIQGLSRVLNAFRGQFDGLNSNSIDRGLQFIAQFEVRKLFLDGSNP
jgi:hypothetical protein